MPPFVELFTHLVVAHGAFQLLDVRWLQLRPINHDGQLVSPLAPHASVVTALRSASDIGICFRLW